MARAIPDPEVAVVTGQEGSRRLQRQMYLGINNKAGQGEWETRSRGPLRTTREYFLRAPFQTRLGLGQTPATDAKCVGSLKSLKLFPHFHIQKLVYGYNFVRSKVPVQMLRQYMSPGFLDPATGTPRVNPGLDHKLKTLLADLKATKPPFDKEPYTKFVSSGAKMSVALVDLSSNAKLVFPQFAEFRSTVETEAASLAKIAALYAAHQLRFDLNHEARQNPLSMTPNRLAGLRAIFDATQVGGAPPLWNFDFNAELREALNVLCHNCSSSIVIGRLGTTYISSVLRQSGLYDCRLGGLWMGTTYANQEEIRKECPEVAKLNAQLAHQLEPIGRRLFHGATALSAAAFFTLLAQGSLVDDAACQSMQGMVMQQMKDCESRFETGLTNAGIALDKVFSKIGVLPSKGHCSERGKPGTCFIHEAALIERVHEKKRLRYVAAVLTESKPGDAANDLLKVIIVKLDELIRKNNP